MKGLAVVLGMAVAAHGCASNQGKNEAVQAGPAAAPASTAAKPPASSKLYFEMPKDGKIYVFGNVSTMQQVGSGKIPSGMVTKENFGPAGETVVFETDGAGLETRLMEEYTKQHPKAK